MNVERGEMVEKELDPLITRRAAEQRRKSEEDRRVEDLWMPSVRAYAERQAEEKRLERLEYHEGQARRLSSTLEALVRYHEQEAERYRSNGHGEESA